MSSKTLYAPFAARALRDARLELLEARSRNCNIRNSRIEGDSYRDISQPEDRNTTEKDYGLPQTGTYSSMYSDRHPDVPAAAAKSLASVHWSTTKFSSYPNEMTREPATLPENGFSTVRASVPNGDGQRNPPMVRPTLSPVRAFPPQPEVQASPPPTYFQRHLRIKQEGVSTTSSEAVTDLSNSLATDPPGKDPSGKDPSGKDPVQIHNIPVSKLKCTSTYFQRLLQSEQKGISATFDLAVTDLSENFAANLSLTSPAYDFPVSKLKYSFGYQEGDVIRVYPSFVLDPQCMFVVHDVNSELASNVDSLAREMGVAAITTPTLVSVPEEGMVVAAWDPKVGEWNRAVIVERLSDKLAEVVFLDFGNSRTLDVVHMMPMNDTWMNVLRLTLPVDLDCACLGGEISETNLFSQSEIIAARKSLTNKTMQLEITKVLPEGFCGKLIDPTESDAEEPRTI